MEHTFINLGIAEDTRSEEEKSKDYRYDIPPGTVILDWKEKDKKEWKRYTPRDQNGSLSCVAQSFAKSMEIIKGGAIFSAHPIYRPRINYPTGGMWPQDAGNICKKSGTTLESLDPS